MIKHQLKNWKSVIGTLPRPKDRPNDFQQLILDCSKNGMNVRDAWRIFGISQGTISDIQKRFSEKREHPDKVYYMDRARKLGADDAVIAQWFGIDRLDKVSMILADVKD